MRSRLAHDPATRVRVLRFALVLSAGLLLCTLLDPWYYQHLTVDPGKTLERKDWWQVLRQAGSVLPWLFVALALAGHDLRARVAGHFPHRAALVVLAPTIAGGLAELLKALTRRGRPLGTGEYRFGWIEPVTGIGMASSHTAVAFAGAFIVGRLFPGSLVPLLVLACGTAWTRLAVGSHYLSDCYVAIVLAWLSANGLHAITAWRWERR